MTADNGGTGAPRVVLGECLTVAYAAEIREQLLAQLRGEGSLILDLSKVQEVDVAGLQLLWATHKSCLASGRRLQLDGGSGVFETALRAAGLSDAGDGGGPWMGRMGVDDG